MKEKFFTYFMELLQNINPTVQFTLILLLAPFFFLLHKVITNKDFRAEFFDGIRRLRRKDTVFNIKNHEIFLTKSIYNNYISNITFNNEIKNVIFKIILQTKISVVISKLRKFINTKDILKQEGIDILVLELIENIVDEYETLIKSKLLRRYKEDADFLYKHIYEDGFKVYHSHNITYILKGVKLFAKSRLSNNQKVYIFFNFVYIALDQAILECEKIFDELNGDLNEYNDKWHDKKKKKK